MVGRELSAKRVDVLSALRQPTISAAVHLVEIEPPFTSLMEWKLTAQGWSAPGRPMVAVSNDPAFGDIPP